MKKSEKKAMVLWLAMWAVMGAMFVYCIPASADGFVLENGQERQLKSLGTYTVTAYCPCRKCCGKWANGITASGATARAGHTIAAPKNFKFGTKLIIDGVIYTVEDRGGAIRGRKLDIYFSDHTSALRYGRQKREVFVYE